MVIGPQLFQIRVKVGVPVHEQGGVTAHARRVANGSTGSQWDRFSGESERQVARSPGREMSFDHIRHVSCQEDEIPNALARQGLDQDLDKGSAGHDCHGFGTIIDHGSQPCAHTTGKNHGAKGQWDSVH
jgi:hypothetical protein